MKLSVIFPTLVVALSFSIAQAGVSLFDESSRAYDSGALNVETVGSYFTSTANYTKEGGQYESLPSGGSYQLMDVDFGARWTPDRTWGFYGTSRVSNAEGKDNFNTRGNSSLSQATLGIDMLMISNSKFDLIPDVNFTYPFERVSTTDDSVLNGEGAMELSARAIARLKWGKIQPFAFAGFTYRDEDRSSLLPYGLGAEWKLGSLSVGADLRGYQSIINDTYTNEQYRRHVVAYRNGGSLKYYSVDPSLLESNFWARWQKNSLGLKVGAGTSLTGANMAAGWTLFAGLNYTLGGSGNSSTPTYRRRAPVPTTPPAFEEDTDDGVDQNLFTAPPPPPPPPPVRKKPAPTPAQRQKKLQNELDQTEFQIELKRKKKRQ